MFIIKDRIDIILVKKAFFLTRQKAKYAIDNKTIFVNGILIDKSSRIVSYDDNIEIRGEILKYVSRGGLKLEKAIRVFGINLDKKICIDIGASTGGFTDCMLQNGATKIYAIDVGHSQLDDSLIHNEKVVNIEGTNIKDMKEGEIESADFIGTDVSFISLTQVLPKVYEFLKIRGKAVILIKPQFEAGKININKNGVVKDIKVHKKVIQNLILLSNTLGFKILKLDYSPIKGPAGNIEYLLYIEKNENNLVDVLEYREEISTIVDMAFKNLK